MLHNIMTAGYTETVNKLVEELGKLPGIGPKTAERLAFHILKAQKPEALALAQAISDVKTKIKQCKICYNFAESDLCPICADTRRDKSRICVVEQPKDVIVLEKTGQCKWVYHVLGGHIAPLDGIEPADLTIDKLIERVRAGGIEEVIMATNPNMLGDGTALYISSLLKSAGVKITRLARGLATGTTLEYASSRMLSDAITARQPLE
ncbi:MAG: recombination mediator RecR [Sedimentisphaerales bacterium]|nr:recombination mediator RecR [Sedimentisphaerales bacterium]